MEASTSSDPKSEDARHKSTRRTSELLLSTSLSSSKRNVSVRSRLALADDSLTPEFDPNAYSAGQSLASILNNPQKGGVYSSDSSWGSWFFSSSTDPFLDGTPLVPSKQLQDISRADLQSYLESISEAYGRFADVQDHSSREELNEPYIANGNSQGRGQGGGLLACLREIPSLYFEEDFALEDGATFQAACPFSSNSKNVILQEKLSHYLDVVEVHLVKEISARSDSFFEAQGQIEDLNAQIVQACYQIQDLRSTVNLLDQDLLEPADSIQNLKIRREHLLGLHQKLKLISYVNQAISALRLLVSAADCAGALDVIDDLQRLIESDELVGLHCFRHLGEHLVSSMDAVNNMLAADFVRTAIHDTSDLEASVILSRFNDREKILSKEIKATLEEEASLREQLLPLVIGLLRTSRLPAVLRIYKDTLITDIKAAIKTAVAELLPLLFKHPSGGDLPSADRQADMDVGGLSLANKLRSLSAEGFVQLLTLVFEIVQDRLLRAAEVRKVVEEIVRGLKGSYAAAAVAAAFASGAAVAAAEAAQEEQLGPTHVNSVVLSQDKSPALFSGHPTTSLSSISRQFRADVLRENTEAVCAACDTAHGRWAKLLGVRALIHPKLRLQEFVSIYNITQDFISDTEKVGGRLGYSIRGTLQSQSKSFIDFHHNTCMSKIVAVLEHDTWMALDVPDEFQVLVNKLTLARFSIDSHRVNISANVTSLLEQPIKSITTSITGQVDLMLDSSGTEGMEGSFDKFETEKIAGKLEDDNQSTLRRQIKGGGNELEKENSQVANALSHNKPSEEAERANGTILSPANQTPVPSAIDVGGQIATSRAKKSREKTSVKTLMISGTSYHMVNSGLILLKMIMEYVDISVALPALATEVVHRVSEILKVFNSRSCQLVLGAGAMQVSGLKSITAKHLALASQSISFFYKMIPYIREILSVHIPDTRKALLLTEIDRVAQDFRVHRDEIHSKLVQIMKERLLVHLRSFSQIVEEWNKADESDSQPSHFARSLTKEVGVLHRVLSPLLLEEDVRSIFTRVVTLFHSQLSDAFFKVELSSPQAKNRLHKDVQHILACMHGLPSEFNDGNSFHKPGELDRFLLENFEVKHMDNFAP
ncbi:hypothetical protein O6H91_08G039800 [Diphasiastrum complanatum]|uniref:Uncharacterized protein n=1 Tax=Diphasiastrum complanatum TaxID=34168 RepID=A0ACC2CWQ7_DIPCM|nr:hypothetical protein O6H91_08G039800 [Diphasiastrum complanatum]